MTAVIALLTFLAQNSQDAPDEGVGLGLILLAVLFVIAVAVGIWLAFTRGSRRRGGTAPEEDPHRPGHVGH
jgi:hypothetical protein